MPFVNVKVIEPSLSAIRQMAAKARPVDTGTQPAAHS
jgi:hypothetical protein